jgi:hypothetical protein
MGIECGMSNNRITQIILGLIIALLLPNLASEVLAQNTKDTTSSNCNVTRVAPDGHTLPVAITDEEYKDYLKIVGLQLPDELISQAKLFLEKHKKSDLRFPMHQNLVTSAIRLNNFDLAFELGRNALAEFPGHVMVMTQLATVASNLMLMGNTTYADEGRTYACTALSFIKEDRTPYGYTVDKWRPYRESLLGDIYQSLGIYNLLTDCPEDSIEALTQAAKLNPNQPYTHFLIAKAQVRLYQWGDRNALTCGGISKSSTVKEPGTLLEQIAKTYALVSVMTEANEQYKLLCDAVNYDMQILGNALGNSLKAEFARSIEAARSEMNASLSKPPAVAVSTVRP